MRHLLAHVRGNAVAYVALFVAMGGTAYAGANLPDNSVGTRQLRNGAVTSGKLANGSVTATKLGTGSVSGWIRMWARIGPDGNIIASKPRAHIVGWSSVDHAGRISWNEGIPPGCFSLATVDGLPAQGFASVATLNESRPPAYVIVSTFGTTGQPAAEPVNVAVVCP
jgi:hypothetical protein